MYYLIITIYTYSSVLIPNPYSSLDSCNKAGENANVSTYRYIEASKDNYCKYHYETIVSPNSSIYVAKKVCDE